jgi:ATP-dependent DNA helicase RecG
LLYDRSFESDVDITNSGELASQLISWKSGQFSERKIFPYATLDDLRIDLVPVVKQLALSRNEKHPWENMSDMELFRSAGLYEEDKMTGNKGFNLAGILLFGKDEVIQSCAPGYVTDCLLRRENLDRYDDRLIVETNLIEAYTKIFEFIEKHTLDRFFLIDNRSISVRSHIAREIVSNILAHREFSSSYRARVVIENNHIITDNWSRPQFEGRIDPKDFTPRSKNPIIAKFFVNIGRADELGSGVRNLYKYTDIYTSGGEPELIEGNVFKIIVPLVSEIKVQPDDLKSNDCTLNPTLNCTLTETEVLNYLKVNPSATQNEVAEAISRSVNTVKNATANLKRLKLLTREGAKKNGRWMVIEWQSHNDDLS